METFPVRWLAAWFRTSHQHWINLIESGELRALDLKSNSATKTMLRVARPDLVEFLSKRSTV